MKKSLLVLSLIGSAALAMAADTPVFQFKMNEGEGNVVKSTGSAAITAKILNKNFEWGAGRKSGKALYFKNPVKCKISGNACVVVENVPKYIDLTREFTVTFWLKLDKELNDNSQYTIVSNVKGDYGPGWRFIYGWGSLRISTGLGDKKSYTMISINGAKFPHAKDVWHHVAITYDRTKCAIYLNGIKAAEKEFKFGAGQSNLTVGAYAGGYAYGFRGAVSDLAIYDKVISADAILAEAQGIK